MERWVLVLWRLDGRAEKDGPKVGEGAEVAGNDEVGQHGAQNVESPDTVEWELGFPLGDVA